MKQKPAESITALDKIIGARLRDRRAQLGLTQQQLAEMVGVTYQQMHKYERAINRLSASRLHALASKLSVPVDYFFDKKGAPSHDDPASRAKLEAAKALSRLSKPSHIQAVTNLARSLASEAA